MKKVNYYMAIVAMIGLFAACNEGNKKSEVSETDGMGVPKNMHTMLPAEMRSMLFKDLVDMLKDSLDVYQQKNLEAENTKIEDVKDIIKEVRENISSTDPKLLDRLEKAVIEMEKAKYDLKTMEDNDYVVRFDELTDTVRNHLLNLKVATPDMENYIGVMYRYNEFNDLVINAFRLRNDYNIYAKQYNNALRQEAMIKKLGDDYAKLKPYPYIYGDEPIVIYEEDTSNDFEAPASEQ